MVEHLNGKNHQLSEQLAKHSKLLLSPVFFIETIHILDLLNNYISNQ
jgi:hypothetical protein